MWFPSLVGRVMPKKTPKHFFKASLCRKPTRSRLGDRYIHEQGRGYGNDGGFPHWSPHWCGCYSRREARLCHERKHTDRHGRGDQNGDKQVITTIPVGQEPVGVAFTPDGKRAYIANFNSNDVSVIDTATKKVVATVRVGTHPSGVEILMARRAASRPASPHKYHQ